MNKKIIALIIIIPVVLMVTIFSVVKGASLIRDIPVSGVEFLNVDDDGFIVRYIDEINQDDLVIKARVLPLNAKNKDIKFSLEEEVISLSDGQNLGKIAEIDPTTGKVNILRVGKVKIYVESNDGGYKRSCILDIRQKYTPANDFEVVPSNIENKLIYVNDEFEIKTIVNPSSAHYKYVSWESSDEKIVRFISSTSDTAKFKALSSGEVTLKATLDLHHPEYESIVKTYQIIVLGEKATPDKIIEKVELIGLPRDVYFIDEHFQDNLYLKVFFKRGNTSFTETIPLVPLLISGFDTSTPKEDAIYTINYQGKEINISYQVKKVMVEKIELPTNIRMRLNANFNLDDYEAVITYNNGEVKRETVASILEKMDLNPILKTDEAKEYHINLSYDDFETVFSYVVVSKIVLNFEYITGLKDMYTVGDLFPNIKIRVKYTDNKLYSDEIITLTKADQFGFSIIGFDTSSAKDSQILLITYLDNPSLNYEHSYQVVDKDVKSFMIIDGLKPFIIDEEVNVSDITLLVEYQDGSNGFLSLDKIITEDSFDTSTIGRKTLNLTYGGVEGEVIYFVKSSINEIDPEKIIKNITLIDNVNRHYYLNEDTSLYDYYLKVTYQGDNYNPVVVKITSSMMDEVDTSIARINTNVITYLGYECLYEYEVWGISSIQILSGLEENYEIWDDVLFENILFQVEYGAYLVPKEIPFKQVVFIGALPKNDILGNKTMVISYEGFEQTFIYEVIPKSVEKIEILGLNNNYYEDDDFDANKIIIKVTYNDQLVKTYNHNSNFIDIIGNLPNPNIIGTYTFTIKHFNFVLEKEIKVLARGISNFNLIGNKEYYLLGQKVKLSEMEVLINYDNNTTKKLPLTDEMLNYLPIDTSKRSENYSFIISLYDAKNDEFVSNEYNYGVFDALVDIDDQKTLSNSKSFTLTVQKTTLFDYGYVQAYDLKFLPQDGVIISIIKNPNGNFEITITLEENIDLVTLYYGLTIDGYEFELHKQITLERIDLESAEIDLFVSSELVVDYGENASVIFGDSFLRDNVTSYEWSTSNENIISLIPYGIPNGISTTIKGLTDGEATLSVIIKVNDKQRMLTKVIKVYKPYEGLAFLDSSKTFGIANELVIGSLDIKNNEFVLAQNYFALRAINYSTVNNENIVWQVLGIDNQETSLASFDASGNLRIYGDGEVLLKANDLIHVNKNMVSPNNTATLKIRVISGVNVRNYEELKIASENSTTNATSDFKKIVVRSNIEVGPKMINITPKYENNVLIGYERTIQYNDMQARAVMAGVAKKIPTTADWTYYKNIAIIKNNPIEHPNINYLIEFKNDVYGNGFTIDAYNVTTLVDKTGQPKSYNPFKGPLNFVEGSVGSESASVKAQDNIVFVVRDNVSINNITLQACDDEFLIESEGSNTYMQLTKLNYVGTTVEIMGNNVSILNSRVKNGRTVLRVYGTENPDDVINVKIESSILSNAREFVLKVGTNKYILGNLDNPSPKLSNYLPNGNYMSNPDFVNEFVKTNVTVKNSVLETAGFFTIGIESKFAGSALAGGPPNLPGWYDLAGTSYVSTLSLDGDVRLYDWKNIDHIDASTLIEGMQMAFDIKDVLNKVKLEHPEFEDLTTVKEGKTYVHGGIAFYGGGKNYSILNLDKFIGPNVDVNFKQYNIIVNDYGGSLKGALDKAAGREPFRFYMYGPNAGISYDEYLRQNREGIKYNWIQPVK